MPPLPDFSDNPFESRCDLVRATTALLSSLEPYKSKDKARIKISVVTAAGFDENAAQLEGFARPLWVVPLLFDESTHSSLNLSSWVEGLVAGTDPKSPEYWGDLADSDQRMVEMESIAFALLSAPNTFLGSMSDSAKTNLRNWLRQINGYSMPQNNWLWFRVFVNLALVKVLGLPRQEVQGQMDGDLETLDTFLIGEGWSSDGLWGDDRKQADYYSGSFAIQFAQLLYIRFAGDEDTARADTYRRRAQQFGSVFWRYFDPQGAAIPFGRSMTYRFAFAAFWSAMACAGLRLPAPLDNIGVIKGMLLRHLRWWSSKTDIFDGDGTLNIGFTYPNMYLSESYNSPQSVYWCLKSFIVLMLPESHEFWTTPELPHPLTTSSQPTADQAVVAPPVQVVWPPRHILCGTPEHHFLLSSGQMSRRNHKAREAKYGKLAYSSSFGFSVPVGPLLEQLAPDSTLCASHDGGETWKVRSEPVDEKVQHIKILNRRTGEDQPVPSLKSVWRPWRYLDVKITTMLIPVMELFPGWHVRVHRVRLGRTTIAAPWLDGIRLVDSGFAMDAETCSGSFIPEVVSDFRKEEGYYTDDKTCLLRSNAGASGVVDLTPASNRVGDENAGGHSSRGFMLKADPNTNLMASRTFIPAIQHRIPISRHENSSDDGIWLVAGVFAIAACAGLDQEMVQGLWLNRPDLRIRIVHDDVEITIV